MPACFSFQAFAAELRKVFGQGSTRLAATGKLLALHQGQRSVMDYAVEFRTVASQSGLKQATPPATSPCTHL